MESTAPVPAKNLELAQHRAEHLVQHGATVTGLSLQAFVVGSSFLWTLLAAPSAFHPQSLVWFLLAAIGFVIAVIYWARGRRRHELLPNITADAERPFAVLTKRQRATITRQMRGKEETTPSTAPLVRAMLLWQRRSTRIVLPTLIGMGIGLIGLGGSTTRTLGGWSFALQAFELVTVLFVTILSLREARRCNRVLTEIGTDWSDETTVR
ncbi:hypothetical protein [Subtercola boreus]|nr:hypothetical protein [Subtercola boreus]